MWGDKDYGSSAVVRVVPAGYIPVPMLAKSFKRLPGVWTGACAAADSGWMAGALVQVEAVVVEVGGKTATEAAAVALLQATVKRRKK